MIMKRPEEGDLWEWRAFGLLGPDLLAAVRARPVRSGVLDRREIDIYLPSPFNQHNVKLRCSTGEWLLKVKRFLAPGPRSIELYRESASQVSIFPLPVEAVQSAVSLLGVRLDDAELAAAVAGPEEFLEAVTRSVPPLRPVKVEKSRSQYELDAGWVETADVTFPVCRIQSLSIHSPSLAVVERALDELQPNETLEPMNYIRACRRWGKEKPPMT
jgi:hypothetical protein